jgi:hypothetical protein
MTWPAAKSKKRLGLASLPDLASGARASIAGEVENLGLASVT